MIRLLAASEDFLGTGTFGGVQGFNINIEYKQQVMTESL
jgi:hypothetical protein